MPAGFIDCTDYEPHPTGARLAELQALDVRLRRVQTYDERDAIYREILERGDLGKGYALGFGNNTQDAEFRCVELNLMEQSNKALALARNALKAKTETLTEGHVLLSKALSGWVMRILKATGDRLTDNEAELFALLITPSGTTKEGATKYPAQRDIARIMGVSAMAVKRQEDKFRRNHPNLAQWLIDHGITRKPRGVRKATVTKRKKKR